MTEASKKYRDEKSEAFWERINRNADTLHARTIFKQGFDEGYAYQEEDLQVQREAYDKLDNINIRLNEKLKIAIEVLKKMAAGEGAQNPSKIAMNRMAIEVLSQITGENK